MTNAPKLSIYSDRSWLYGTAPAAVGRLFAEAPRHVIPARTRLPFGDTHVVALVENGLLATYAGFQGEFRLITGLFGPGSILGGVKAMIDDNRYCGDVLIQLAAIDAAVKSVSRLVLQNHLETCVVEQIQRGNTEVVDEVMALFKRLS